MDAGAQRNHGEGRPSVQSGSGPAYQQHLESSSTSIIPRTSADPQMAQTRLAGIRRRQLFEQAANGRLSQVVFSTRLTTSGSRHRRAWRKDAEPSGRKTS